MAVQVIARRHPVKAAFAIVFLLTALPLLIWGFPLLLEGSYPAFLARPCSARGCPETYLFVLAPLATLFGVGGALAMLAAAMRRRWEEISVVDGKLVFAGLWTSPVNLADIESVELMESVDPLNNDYRSDIGVRIHLSQGGAREIRGTLLVETPREIRDRLLEVLQPSAPNTEFTRGILDNPGDGHHV